jgi:1-acyl-sn-glycerol-3-phosphate acyltransferase
LFFTLKVLGVLLSIMFLVAWWKRDYIRKVSQSGFLAAPPSGFALWFARRYCQALVDWQVGKVQVEGIENLQVDGPMLIAPNHGHFIDPMLFPLILGRPARFMAAQGVFEAAGGLMSLLAAPCGAFAVNLNPGKGAKAADAAVEVLTTGQTLVMFPEGYAWLDGHVDKFKKGAVRIIRRTAVALGRTCYIVPVYIRYGRYPGERLLRWSPAVQYMLLFLLARFFRKGATVVFGKPISSDELPADDAEATDLLRQKVLELDPQRNVARACDTASGDGSL